MIFADGRLRLIERTLDELACADERLERRIADLREIVLTPPALPPRLSGWALIPAVPLRTAVGRKKPPDRPRV